MILIFPKIRLIHISVVKYLRAMVTQEKKQVIRNLYLSGIGEEFIAMQLDLEIIVVIDVLKELGEYKF